MAAAATGAIYFGRAWSVAAEEQFYLLFPLLLMALRARRAPLVFSMHSLLGVGLVLRGLKLDNGLPGNPD